MARGAPSVPFEATFGHPLLGMHPYARRPYKKGPQSFTARPTTVQGAGLFTVLCPSWVMFKWGGVPRS